MILLLTIGGVGCDNFRKPHLDLSGNNPYLLKISDFNWGYGTAEVNRFNGDFDGLDRKIYSLLRGKIGVCTVLLEEKRTNKYGKSVSQFVNIGTIDLTELNKFEDVDFWRKDGGMHKLFTQHYQLNSGLSNSTVQADTSNRIDTAILVSGKAQSKVYSFTITDLFTADTSRAKLSPAQSPVNGVITEIDSISELRVIMKIAADDGETYSVFIYPYEASFENHRQLILALKQGNKISSICAINDGSTLNLVSADIIEQ
jgi:hypothetical protein